MGFWHTGYIEFHEPVGFDEHYIPTPPVYRCKHCNATFPDPAALRAHRFESHPYNRPLLWINGIEVGTTPIRITNPIGADDVLSGQCERAWLNDSAVSLAHLGGQLASITNDTVHVRLENDGVSADFTLKFQVASETDIDGVDRCFFNVARMMRLDMRAIEDFIAAARVYPSAIPYLDGVCSYFFGVLAKEKSAESSLPYDAYREKFNQAADALKDFHRPLARTISALIAFHFNHFPEARELAASSRVGAASKRFVCWLDGDTLEAERLTGAQSDDSLERLLTDLEAERLLSWTVASNQPMFPSLQEMESLLKQDIPEFDRTKLRILMSEFYAQNGNISEARRHARELRNSPTLGVWAERFLTRLNEKE